MPASPSPQHLPDRQALQACARRDVLWLAALALILRLAYLWLGTREQSLSDMSMWANDTGNYLSAASFWLSGDPAGAQALLLAGPGYSLVLAVFQTLFAGAVLWPALLLNLLFGCAAPVVVYLLAVELTGRRAEALGAGLIAAASVTSLSVSTSILSDQPFFTLHALSLLWFVLGWKNNCTRWFVLAGMTAGVATWIRVMGQVWPVVFLFIATLVALLESSPSNWMRWRRSLWTPGILLVLILGWSSYNYSRHGLFTLTSNGARSAWLYLGARALSMNTPGLDVETARDQISAELERVAGPEHSEVAMYRYSAERITELGREHPGWLVRAFAHNVKENLQESNYDLYRQLPQCKSALDVFTRQARDHLNEGAFFGALIGIFLLMKERNHLAWITLGATLAVFTLITGFSFWQGSRLHYPAEMAWSILLSYFLIATAQWIRRRFFLRHKTVPA